MLDSSSETFPCEERFRRKEAGKGEEKRGETGVDGPEVVL